MTRYMIIGKDKYNNLHFLAENSSTHSVYWTTIEECEDIIFLVYEGSIKDYIESNMTEIRRECKWNEIISVGYGTLSSHEQKVNYILEFHKWLRGLPI